MHLNEGYYKKYFPDAATPAPDGTLPLGSQPSFAFRDAIVEVGHNPNGDHLHFEVADISGETFDTAGAGRAGCLF